MAITWREFYTRQNANTERADALRDFIAGELDDAAGAFAVAVDRSDRGDVQAAYEALRSALKRAKREAKAINAEDAVLMAG